jgi:hypothetical protein
MHKHRERTPYPNDAYRAYREARLRAGALRHSTQAFEDVEWLESLVEVERPADRPLFELAVIWSALGDLDRAGELMEEADRTGGMGMYEFFRTDMHLAPRRDYPPFQELMRPKG